jgi:uncharacterized membrane protein
MDLISESWVHWLTASFFGILLVMQLAFQPETLYSRTDMCHLMPVPIMASDASAGNSCGKRSYLFRDASACMYVCMYSYTDAGVADAELLLVTCLKRKTLRGIKTSSHQCVFCKAPCCL